MNVDCWWIFLTFVLHQWREWHCCLDFHHIACSKALHMLECPVQVNSCNHRVCCKAGPTDTKIVLGCPLSHKIALVSLEHLSNEMINVIYSLWAQNTHSLSFLIDPCICVLWARKQPEKKKNTELIKREQSFNVLSWTFFLHQNLIYIFRRSPNRLNEIFHDSLFRSLSICA